MDKQTAIETIQAVRNFKVFGDTDAFYMYRKLSGHEAPIRALETAIESLNASQSACHEAWIAVATQLINEVRKEGRR